VRGGACGPLGAGKGEEGGEGRGGTHFKGWSVTGRERRGGGSGAGCHAAGEVGAGAHDRVGERVRHRHDARTE
jgi:hypothetical protein